MPKTESFEYKWAGEYGAVLDGHSTPDGAAVVLVPGEKFQTIAAVNTTHVPKAVPVSPDAVKAAKAEETEGTEAPVTESVEVETVPDAPVNTDG